VQRERKKKVCVCCEAQGRNRSAVLLADFLFPAVQHRFSPTHTHTHTHSFPRPCSFFFFAVPFFSPTLSPINLFACLKPPSPTHTGSSSAHWNHRQVKYILFLFSEVPSNSFHMGITPASALSNAYFGVYDGRVERVVGCSYQIIGESIKTNHITNKLWWDR